MAMTIKPVVSSLRGDGPREWSGRLPPVFGLALDTASFYPCQAFLCDSSRSLRLKAFSETNAKIARLQRVLTRAFSESPRPPDDSPRVLPVCHCLPWGEIPHN